MQTKQIIQASANVIRITAIQKGNIYKRFDDNYTWYGVVTAVHNDGVNAIIEATEYRKGWSSIDVQYKTMNGTKDYTIFPASIEDFNLEFSGVIETLQEKIVKAKNEIVQYENQISFTKKLISGEMQKELSSPMFKEMSQEEFNQKMLAIN